MLFSKQFNNCLNYLSLNIYSGGVISRPSLPSRVVLLLMKSTNATKESAAALRTNKAYAQHHGYAYREFDDTSNLLLTKITATQTALEDGFEIVYW